MGAYPMYVFAEVNDFEENGYNGGPDEYELAGSPDFAPFGDYVSHIEDVKTLEQRIEAAEEVAKYIGDFVSVENGTLVFRKKDAAAYAKRKMAKIQEVLDSTSPTEFLAMGAYRLKEAVNSTRISAYPTQSCGDYADGFIQSMDYFVREVFCNLKEDEEARFVIPQVYYIHS
jgi:hypothetical protein